MAFIFYDFNQLFSVFMQGKLRSLLRFVFKQNKLKSIIIQFKDMLILLPYIPEIFVISDVFLIKNYPQKCAVIRVEHDILCVMAAVDTAHIYFPLWLM